MLRALVLLFVACTQYGTGDAGSLRQMALNFLRIGESVQVTGYAKSCFPYLLTSNVDFN